MEISQNFVAFSEYMNFNQKIHSKENLFLKVKKSWHLKINPWNCQVNKSIWHKLNTLIWDWSINLRFHWKDLISEFKINKKLIKRFALSPERCNIRFHRKDVISEFENIQIIILFNVCIQNLRYSNYFRCSNCLMKFKINTNFKYLLSRSHTDLISFIILLWNLHKIWDTLPLDNRKTWWIT